jgi:hypothetical protein
MIDAPYYDPDADWSSIPQYMHGGVSRYVMHGIPPGNFLTAVFCNDLTESFARADDVNAAAMHDWVRFIYNCTPSGCHGSPEQFKAWIERGGIAGREADK